MASIVDEDKCLGAVILVVFYQLQGHFSNSDAQIIVFWVNEDALLIA